MVKSLSFWQSDNSGLRQSLRNPYVFQCFAYVSALTIIRLTIRLRQAVNNISRWHKSAETVTMKQQDKVKANRSNSGAGF